MMVSKRGRRGGVRRLDGRPHALTRPVLYQGRTMGAAQAVIEILRTGEPIYLAADALGLARDTVYGWRKDGARLWSEITEGRRSRELCTPYEQAALAFSEAVSAAEAEAELTMARIVVAAATGTSVRQRVVEEFDEDGFQISRKVVTDTLPPDARAALAWLERRVPARWGRSQRIEHALGDDENATIATDPLGEFVRKLEEVERRTLEGEAQLSAVLDATSTDTTEAESA